MKCLLLILFTYFALTTAETDDRFHRMTMGLARAFTITQSEAEQCVHKMAATTEDLDMLDDVIIDKVDVDKNSIRRATCALTCCAQKQGTMVGAKLQLPVIQKLIQNADIPQEVKYHYYTSVTECANEVKNITDECVVGFGFVKCLIQSWEDAERREKE